MMEPWMIVLIGTFSGVAVGFVLGYISGRM